MTTSQQQAVAIIRLRDVKARTGRSRSSIYTDIKVGCFPAPISIGPRAVGWIDDWIAGRIAASRGAAK